MTPSARRTLVTGASRPQGLEAVKQCLERGDRVIAASRNPARVPVLADWRAKYGTLELLALDPADAVSVAEAIPMLESITSSLDLLIIGPGEPGTHEQNGDKREHELGALSTIDLVEHYRRHAVAPMLLVRTLLPWLTAGEQPRVLFLHDAGAGASSRQTRASYSVTASAAALQSIVPILAEELSMEGVDVASAPSVTSATSADAS